MVWYKTKPVYTPIRIFWVRKFCLCAEGNSQLKASISLSLREYLSSDVISCKCSNKPSCTVALKLCSHVYTVLPVSCSACRVYARWVSVDIGSIWNGFPLPLLTEGCSQTKGYFSISMNLNHHWVTGGFSSHVPPSICFQTQDTYLAAALFVT